MALTQFHINDYQQLVDWIDSPELNYLWGGPKFTFPLDYSQIDAHVSLPQCQAFFYLHNGERAGYVELFEVDEHIARICRVFIHPSFRGHGIAKKMLVELIEIAKQQHYTKFSLCVFSQNIAAIRCYESLGFVETKREQGTRVFNGQSWELIYMDLKLEE